MKFFVASTLAVGVNSACISVTCKACNANAGCGWYQSSIGGTVMEGDVFGACKNITEVKANTLLNGTMTQIATCPACQAGTCSECKDSALQGETCQWFLGPLGIGSHCATASAAQPVGFTTPATCPLCPAVSSGATCTNCENTVGCRWYTDLFGGAGECSDGEPFGKTIVPKAACGGNPCRQGADCSSCRAIEVNGTKPCSWLRPKDFYAPFKQAKCDLIEAKDVDTVLYEAPLTGTCPSCSGNTCSSCQGETGCRYTATEVLGAYGFGKCIGATDSIPDGKKVIATCRDSCAYSSCEECVSDTLCAWWDKTVVYNAGCDIKASPKLLDHIGTTPVSSCPACAFSDCVGCRASKANTCGWFVNTYPWGDAVQGSGDCEKKPYTPVVLEQEVTDSSDAKLGACTATAESSGFIAVPAFAALAAMLF